ncbi:hypothetical protein K1T71_010511 [Dendrolimus kikuchii]|uniref:Uncharacterized protein n=1 Tax=Dendrolimus kikuchii TaxID=765133 RepID=A0ACC1CSF6_9NEOP|nr:hypothetical protein K1T71_010511 [Dendrolimus kikuchii]
MAAVEKTLRDLIEKIAVEQGFKTFDIEIKPISSGGANYSSVLFLVKISGDKDDLKLFAKVSTMGEKMRENATIDLFNTERYFYTKLMQIYRDIEERHNIPAEHRINIPKYYGNNPNYLEETIVLEDLACQGFTVYDRTKSIDWAYASTAIEELAKFHALSYALAKENPEEFETALKSLKFKVEVSDEMQKQIFEKSFKSAIEAAKDEHKEKLMHYVSKIDRQDFEKYKIPMKKPVLCHEDYRVSNHMYKRNEDGSVIIKVMDFQTMQGSSPVVDLFYLVITGTDEEFRREHYQRLVEHYYEQLCAALKRLDINPDDVYSRADYDEELRKKLPYSLAMAIFLLPLITVETEDAPVMDEDADLTSFTIDKVSDIYPERMRGIISDYVRWGIL